MTRAFPIARGVVLLLGAMLTATPADAQRDERFGDVRVHTETDSAAHAELSYAVLMPDDHPRDGALAWACGGESNGFMAVFLIPNDSLRRGARVVWRFDGGAPDSAQLIIFFETRAPIYGTMNGAPLTRQARTASRLQVRLELGIPGRPATEYVYNLAGVDSATKRLGCAPGSARFGMAGGLPTLRMLVATPDAASPLGLARPVRLLDGDELQRQFTRGLPRADGPRVRGTITLRFRVIEDGTVDPASIEVVSSTHPELDPLAMQAVRAARFRPATVDGRPISTTARIPIEFSAPRSAAPAP